MDSVEALPKSCFYYSEGNQGTVYLSFFVSKMREPDRYGNDCTVYALEKMPDGKGGFKYGKRYIGKGRVQSEKNWGK